MAIAVPFPRDVAKYIAEAEADIKNTVLLGGPHDPMSLALANIIGMQRALIEGDLVRLVELNTDDWDAMDCETLYRRGADLDLPLRGAGPARGTMLLQGVVGTPVPPTLTIRSGGVEFGIDPLRSPPTSIGATGAVTVPIVAVDPGVKGNQALPGTGVLSTNITGVTTHITNVVATGGYDAETCADYRERVKAVDALDNTSGSEGWHVRRAYRYPGVTRVCVDPCRCCEGQVSMFVFAAGRFVNAIPDDAFVSEVQNAVFDTPIGSTVWGSKLMGRTGYVKAAKPKPIKVRISGTSGMLPDARKRTTDEIASYFMSLCPGGSICKSTILATASAHGVCPSVIAFDYAGGFNDNGQYLTAECDILPILTEVCLV